MTTSQDGNKVEGNSVLSGLDLFNGNSASADGNSAGLSIGRRDVVLLPPSPMDDVVKAISSIAVDNGSSNQVDISKLLSGNGNGNGNSNTVGSGNGVSRLYSLTLNTHEQAADIDPRTGR